MTVTDAASASRGFRDLPGETHIPLCGPRTYQLTNTATTSTFASLTTVTAASDTLSLLTNTFADASVSKQTSTDYPEILNICLDWYPNDGVAFDTVPCLDISFTIRIEPCKIVAGGFTSDFVIGPQTWSIWYDFATIPGDEKYVTIPTFTQTPDCQYVISLSSTIEMTAAGPAADQTAWNSNGVV